ncbi:MAG: hypothetical protein AAB074_13220 [Planctomycetota bacterium]
MRTLALCLLTLSTACRAEDTAAATSVLDGATRALEAQISGGQAMGQFWDGFEEGTEIEFRHESTRNGVKQESSIFYQILKRDGRSLSLRVKSGDQDRTIEIQGLPEGAEDMVSPLREKPVDQAIPGREIVQVGDKEYSCTVSERTVKSYPQCGTGEPQFRIHRVRAWHCSDVAAQGGVLKVVATWEEEWGEGLQVKLRTELAVTELNVKRKIGDIELTCYAVSTSSRCGEIVNQESAELRMDTTPGRIIDSTEKSRDSEGKSDWVTSRHWVGKMSLTRKATIEKK